MVLSSRHLKMSRRKKLIRQKFRRSVFSRDDYKCAVCGVPEKDVAQLDAHHVTDRSLMPNGGYVEENGITLCPECHRKAEVWHATDHEECVPGYHPDALYEIIGSSAEEAVEASEEKLS